MTVWEFAEKLSEVIRAAKYFDDCDMPVTGVQVWDFDHPVIQVTLEDGGLFMLDVEQMK